MGSIAYNSIDEYIALFDGVKKEKLIEIRNIIKGIVPKETIEKISWAMPTFYLNGNLVHFACSKNHMGLYPGASGVEKFKEELRQYKTSKGAIQFPYDKPLPKELIEKIVAFRINENLNNL